MDIKERVAQGLEKIKEIKPLVHQITNQVTMNDCANMTIAIGASPIMTSHPWEVGDVAEKANAIVLNLGTLQDHSVDAMLRAGRVAAERGVPLILDPVGVGGSSFRSEAALTLLADLPIQIIRGNSSELRYLGYGKKSGKGVDAEEKRSMNKEEIQEIAARLQAVVAVTGAIDYISNETETYALENGSSFLPLLTGSGCMTTALIGAFAAVLPPLEAAVGGVLAMGISGEYSEEKTKALCGGPGTFRMYLHDGIYLLRPMDMIKKGKVAYV